MTDPELVLQLLRRIEARIEAPHRRPPEGFGGCHGAHIRRRMTTTHEQCVRCGDVLRVAGVGDG